MRVVGARTDDTPVFHKCDHGRDVYLYPPVGADGGGELIVYGKPQLAYFLIISRESGPSHAGILHRSPTSVK
jgi:hypothetical protein